MNYRPMFTFPSGERVGNAQVFATREEAQGSAEDRFRVWNMPTGCGVDETTDPVNYRWTTHKTFRCSHLSLQLGATLWHRTTSY